MLWSWTQAELQEKPVIHENFPYSTRPSHPTVVIIRHVQAHSRCISTFSTEGSALAEAAWLHLQHQGFVSNPRRRFREERGEISEIRSIKSVKKHILDFFQTEAQIKSHSRSSFQPSSERFHRGLDLTDAHRQILVLLCFFLN